MKVAITGAHRVGETTLAEELQKALTGYEFIQEPYYEMEESGYMFSEIPTVDDYLAQLKYSIKQISGNKGNVIFDRCPLDFMAYIEAINGQGYIQSLYGKVEDVMKEIDLLVFVHIESRDIVRCDESDLPELRHQVNDILSEWVWDFETETIEVTGTQLARKKQIIDTLARIAAR